MGCTTLTEFLKFTRSILQFLVEVFVVVERCTEGVTLRFELNGFPFKQISDENCDEDYQKIIFEVEDHWQTGEM